jgi:phosphatidylinositol-3,4,5-trisphosphate 3-phosphatase/dual-specificity protein phosphatase PTEN
MYEYLMDPNNVVVIHCNAGKGRTGTSIAWFLLYTGLSNTAEDAIRYYGRKRFSTGLGITQPSQIRYVRYFELALKGIIKSPTLKMLKEIKMNTIPNMKLNAWKPYIEIITLKDFKKVYTGKHEDNIQRFKATTQKPDQLLKESENNANMKIPFSKLNAE